MAKATTSTVPDNSTDALFRAWAMMIPAILTAGGFVQTADSGQTDFSTLVAPTALNQSRGYQIWRSNDAAGGLNNWYVKIEVGSGAATGARTSIWLTVGWGSDGAGNITGNATARTQFTNGTNSTGVSVNSNLWANTEAFHWALWIDNGTNFFTVINIERVRSNTGAKTDELFIWGTTAVSGSGYVQVLPRTGAIPSGSVDKAVGQRLIPSAMAGYTGNYGFGTIAPIKGGFLMEAGNMLIVDNTNFTAGQSEHQVTVYGEIRNYILGLNIVAVNGASTHRLLSRYDS